MPIKKEIKIALAEADITLTDAIKIKNDKYKSSDTLQNVSNKIRGGTLKYDDAEKIADCIGYSIIWQKKNETGEQST